MATTASLPPGSNFEGHGTWKWIAVASLLFIAVDKLGVFAPDDGHTASLLGVGARALSESASSDHHASSSGIASEHQEGEGHGGGHSEHAHPHEAMFFLIAAILIGTFIMHLTRLPIFHSLQQTVVLFVLGCCCSLLLEGAGAWEHLGAVGRSYSMWMVIDPHVLLFTLLPPLLAGDAMTIDTNIAGKVVNQCLYLAGPGVLINALLTATFLWAYLPYEWPFLLCLTAGAILCATDPVAVVALLKELGASPILTVQIQGESLLNDGTAIVLYTICYGMLKGETYSNEDIVIFLVKTALYAWFLGMIVGGLFFLWIRAAKNKFDHNSGMIQVSLTICCAYFSFIFAEGILKVSGVLATVAASLMLAHRMWPEIVSHEMMSTIWHTFEYLGNTVIFFLAGALTGNIMLRTPWVDYLHLVFIYVILTLVRGALIFLSRPLLKVLSATWQPVTMQDAAVMSWGGLRGAVGLALAIQVSIDRAGGELSASDADRVLFYVGGVALLTLVVNATTCPILVRWLGITQVPEAKRQLMLTIHQQMVDQLDAKELAPATRSCLQAVLRDVEHHLQKHGSSLADQDTHSLVPTRQSSAAAMGARKTKMEAAQRLEVRHQEAAERFSNTQECLRQRLLRMLPDSPASGEREELLKLVREDFGMPMMVRAINEAFLKLIQAEYWKQIEHGEVSTEQGRLLLSSVASCLSSQTLDVYDLQHVIPQLEEVTELSVRNSVTSVAQEDLEPSCVRLLVESLGFNLFIAGAIVSNVIFVLLDYYINSETEGHPDMVWFILEVLFTSIFTLEVLLRLADAKLRFFLSGWNLFDSTLVVLGIVGIGLHAAFFENQSSFGAKEAQLARIVRVFKVLRLFRVVRFVRIARLLDARIRGKETSEEVATRMQRFDVLVAYIKAHRAAEGELLRYFGKHGRAESVEVARCLLQSEVSVYKAMTICAEEDLLQDWLIDEFRVCQSSFQVSQEMETFLLGARQAGVLSATEAESLVHTVHRHMHRFASQLQDARHGRVLQPHFSSVKQQVVASPKWEEAPFLEDKPGPTLLQPSAYEDSEGKSKPGGASSGSRRSHGTRPTSCPPNERWGVEQAQSRGSSRSARAARAAGPAAVAAEVEDRETSSTRSSGGERPGGVRSFTRCAVEAEEPSPRALRAAPQSSRRGTSGARPSSRSPRPSGSTRRPTQTQQASQVSEIWEPTREHRRGGGSRSGAARLGRQESLAASEQWEPTPKEQRGGGLPMREESLAPSEQWEPTHRELRGGGLPTREDHPAGSSERRASIREVPSSRTRSSPKDPVGSTEQAASNSEDSTSLTRSTVKEPSAEPSRSFTRSVSKERVSEVARQALAERPKGDGRSRRRSQELMPEEEDLRLPSNRSRSSRGGGGGEEQPHEGGGKAPSERRTRSGAAGGGWEFGESTKRSRRRAESSPEEDERSALSSRV